MTTQNYNIVQVIYNSEHEPYLYGAVLRVDGDLSNQWWERPFVVSKRSGDGEEVVYGTIKRLLEKIVLQVDRLQRFQLEAQAMLDATGITLSPQDEGKLPKSEVTDRIIDEQEELVEDVLLTTSVNVRILSEIFPQKLGQSKISVYDYDEQVVAQIELSQIANLLVHNRYICIRNPYVVDLMSDRRFMDTEPQAGLKINTQEYFSQVGSVVEDMTVNDLVDMLESALESLSASSNIKDIIHLHQNLYTLGGFVVGNGIHIADPLRIILDRVAMAHLESKYANAPPLDGNQESITVFYSTPRFSWEPDLNKRQIHISLQVNGEPETLVMGYEEFFSELLKGYGSTRLLSVLE